MSNQKPRDACDVIMKGGITSGIVYPPAILALQKKYRFRNIGGASAGAIAAAAVAAAQYGESSGGFEKLEKLNAQLGDGQFVLNLFRSSAREDAKALLDLALAAQRTMGPGGVNPELMGIPKIDDIAKRLFQWPFVVEAMEILARAHAAMRRENSDVYERGKASATRVAGWVALALASAAGACGLACTLVAVLSIGTPLSALALLPSLALALLVMGLVFGLVRTVGGMFEASRWILSEDNLYGLCPGYDESAGATTLVGWLHDNIEAMANKAPDTGPLTFGDLERTEAAEGATPIDLRMVTTDLSVGRPFMLPLDTGEFIFDESEMRRLLPKAIVDYMVEARAPKTSEDHARREHLKLPPGHHWLPSRKHMPVILAIRMSLSFPVLVAAVPLYRISDEHWKARRRGEEHAFAKEHLERHWFSDGGISSNFPIHFFDRWIPDCPTFGINLTRTKTPTDAPWLPEPKETQAVDLRWSRIQGIVSFVWSIVDTAMNYRDNLQAQLPSYRERIVQVPLNDTEGGLNLRMDEDVIRNIQEKGRLAGEKLLEKFDFPQHRWVRFRVLAAHLEHELGRSKAEFLGKSAPYEEVMKGQTAAREHAEADGERAKADALLQGLKPEEAARIGQAARDRALWYRSEKEEWCNDAFARMAALMGVAGEWAAKDLAAERAAKAAAELAAKNGDERAARRDEPKGFFAAGAPKPTSALRVTPEM